MFRFDQLTRRDMIIRDVKRSYPQPIPISGRLRFHPACDHCDIETAARQNGLNSPTAAQALNPAAFGFKADTEDHASQ